MQEKIALSTEVIRAAIVSDERHGVGDAALINQSPHDGARGAASCSGLLREAFGKQDTAQLEGTVDDEATKSIHREAKGPSNTMGPKGIVKPVKSADERLGKLEPGTHGSLLLAR